MKDGFSKIVDVETLKSASAPLELGAAKEDLAVLAARVEVLEVLEFNATFNAINEGPELMHLHGEIEARLVQECVRTLEPVNTSLKDAFSVLLMGKDTAEQYLATREEDELEDIEILDSDTVDLGEIATQYLSLAIDRFPVKEGAALGIPEDADVKVMDEEEDKEAKNPFSALKNLHKKG